MKPDPKKTASALVLSLGKPPKGSPGFGAQDEDPMDAEGASLEDAALESAADDVMSAIKAGDSAALAVALKAAVKCCGSED